MTQNYSNLAYLSEHVMDEQSSWLAAQLVGGYAVEYMQHSGAGHQASYDIDGLDDILCGVSEQPDLTGPKNISLFHGEGTWLDHRPNTASYNELIKGRRTTESYIGLEVLHAATYETLLQVALPLTEIGATCLRDGYVVMHTIGDNQRGICSRYNANDLQLNPRRIRAAAGLVHHLIGNTVPPVMDDH